MCFRLYPLRFSFVARDAVHFPEGKSGNLLRGAFGSILRKLAGSSVYERMFEPTALEGGPSGLKDWPRPFVFRASHLDGKTIRAGETFSFDLNLFDMRSPAVTHLTLAFGQLAQEGLGPGRGRAELTSVEPASTTPPMQLDLAPVDGCVERCLVQFVTPTELKSGQQVVARPEFGVLAARIRDRLSTLKECWDDGPLEMDFRGFGERAERVRMTRCEIRHVDVERRSSRTGQVHSIGGFVGESEYEGDLGEFVPYLRAAQWTGVGRQTVWGKGEIRYVSL